ncbi:MAG: formate dehydrogenase accessory sulfurtransferase FdhD [Raoultibacter sp.]
MAVVIERITHTKDLSRERPITIYFNDRPMAVSQGTPANLSELAVGFLLSEGILQDRDKLRGVDFDLESATVYVASDEVVGERAVMHRVTSSGCSQARLLQGAPMAPAPQTHPLRFQAEELLAMMEELCLMSPRRNNGECVHGCGIGRAGALACVREDIGRHNAMDKLLGQAWLDRLPVSEMAVFTTGRISYEMALKASQAGASVMVSHKSATTQAIEAAEELGLTLVAKCREGSMQVLTWHDRVV